MRTSVSYYRSMPEIYSNLGTNISAWWLFQPLILFIFYYHKDFLYLHGWNIIS